MAALSVIIRISKGEHSQEVTLKSLPVTFGRGSDCDFELDDKAVSRRHFQFRDQEGLLVVEDLDSANGTLLGEEFIHSETLFPGDILNVGSTALEILQIQIPAPQSDLTARTHSSSSLSSSSPDRDWVGQEFAGLKILDVLGKGGNGRVYLAHQVTLNRDVALKAMLPQLAKDVDSVADFIQEAQAVAALSHPLIVQVFDVGKHQGVPYFYMEYMPGGSLEDQLALGGVLDWRVAAEAAEDCVSALEFAWEKGLLHHDVKPANLLMSAEGETKLADLGIASSRHRLEGVHSAGSPHFMAPERILKQDVDFRSDFYSLGCTLFRLLTGHHVYPHKKVRDILRSHCQGDPPSLRDFDVDVPDLLVHLVARLMRKDPESRPSSHENVRRDLALALRASGPSASGRSGGVRPPGLSPRRKGRRTASKTMQLAIFLPLGLLVVLSFFFLPDSLKGWREFIHGPVQSAEPPALKTWTLESPPEVVSESVSFQQPRAEVALPSKEPAPEIEGKKVQPEIPPELDSRVSLPPTQDPTQEQIDKAIRDYLVSKGGKKSEAYIKLTMDWEKDSPPFVKAGFLMVKWNDHTSINKAKAFHNLLSALDPGRARAIRDKLGSSWKSVGAVDLRNWRFYEPALHNYQVAQQWLQGSGLVLRPFPMTKPSQIPVPPPAPEIPPVVQIPPAQDPNWVLPLSLQAFPMAVAIDEELQTVWKEWQMEVARHEEEGGRLGGGRVASRLAEQLDMHEAALQKLQEEHLPGSPPYLSLNEVLERVQWLRFQLRRR